MQIRAGSFRRLGHIGGRGAHDGRQTGQAFAGVRHRLFQLAPVLRQPIADAGQARRRAV